MTRIQCRSDGDVGASLQSAILSLRIFSVLPADDLIHTDLTACLLESRQKKDERLLAEAIVSFRQQFQQPSSRREFDLNDPEVLKKQEGVRILPGLVGEDLDSGGRTQRQREQLRDWTLQQQQELDQVKEVQRLKGNYTLPDFR